MRSARWTSRSRAPSTASPRSKWTSKSRGSRSTSCARRSRKPRTAGCSSSTSSRKRSPKRAPELSPYAPRMIVLTINPDKIKDVIGPGGKIINKIIADTGVKIDIENDGRVFIASPDGEGAERAKKMVEALTKDVAGRRDLHGDGHAPDELRRLRRGLAGQGRARAHQPARAEPRREGRRRRQDRRRDHGQGRRDRFARPHQSLAARGADGRGPRAAAQRRRSRSRAAAGGAGRD
jgi:polyribonucleotide nucleotidyltransferase